MRKPVPQFFIGRTPHTTPHSARIYVAVSYGRMLLQVEKLLSTVDSPERMTEVIREIGIIPFFRSGIPGWSIEEMTDPAFWFYTSDELGPWDWKIDAVRQGDIAYGKFLSGKASFATAEWYRHLMNIRRAEPKYRMALGERFQARTRSEKLMKYLAPVALEAIRENGSLEMSELRSICGGKVTDSQIRVLGTKYRDVLRPTVKINVMDSVMQFLEMGTWTVIGDFRRIYRGTNLEYSGWQRASITTPDALFGSAEQPSQQPFWAKIFETERCGTLEVTCTPQESRQILIDHLASFFPEHRDTLTRII